MVGPQYDFLANPVGAVRLTFEKAVASGSAAASAALDGGDWGAADLFYEFLYDNGGLSLVPILTAKSVESIQSGTLVRFRGMIQDMPGNEFYAGAYKDGEKWRTNKFTDASQSTMCLSCNMRIWERRLLFCVPVPGQNSWTESSSELVLNQYKNLISPRREKRQREDGTSINDMDMQVSDNEFQDFPHSKKMRERGHPLSSELQDSTSGPNMNTLLDFEKNSLPCLVKLYDSPEDELKLNDVFEFVGVLNFSLGLTVDNRDSDEFRNDLCEEESINWPPSKVPHLHCLVHRKLAVHDFLPNSPMMEPKPNLVREIRGTLLRYLTAVLGNDGLAAHFMLLHLLSRVHARVDTLAVGKLSLNLTCFSKETASIFGNRITIALKNLLPFTHCIPLTLDYLNTTTIAPRKDYQTNRLISGVLQLAGGSHLTIDETHLQSGNLNSVGIKNARLLKNLMELQKVEYDFKFYNMEMDADIQILIISEVKSNILPADLVLPFSPSSVGFSETLDVEALKAWRWYLATIRSLPHSIYPEMRKVVEEDLVAARQADRSLGSQDFSRWLTMARLMSASFGETQLSLECWQMVKELERLRRERIHSN